MSRNKERDDDRSHGFRGVRFGDQQEVYRACLAPLGLRLLEENKRGDAQWLVFGTGDEDPFFVVSNGTSTFWKPKHTPGTSPIHVAFVAQSRDAVDEFYAAGLAADGRDNGGPGARGDTYYAAYLIDPDGNNIEAGFRE